MQFTSFLENGRLTVALTGEIDHHCAKHYIKAIGAKIDSYTPEECILDFSEVSFMDSSGLGLIMGRYSVIKELGGDMTVWNPSRETRAILNLAGMERLVRIEYPEGKVPDLPADKSVSEARTPTVKPRRRRTRSTSAGIHAQAAKPMARKEKEA
jgi:stage II sporulation protein AA (anti-sigma F factor antagonist)